MTLGHAGGQLLQRPNNSTQEMNNPKGKDKGKEELMLRRGTMFAPSERHQQHSNS